MALNQRFPKYINRLSLSLAMLLLILANMPVFAETPVTEIRIKDHLFIPSKLLIPRDTKIKILIINEDKTSEEFESYELNREKVIMGNARGIIFIGPLEPGVYPFFGEFNPLTAQGTIEVK